MDFGGQLSAEKAFRLLQQKHNHDDQGAWARFEAELAKRVGEVKQRHSDELRALGGRIRELESAAKVSEQQNTLNVQRVRAELEGKLRSEQSQKEDLNRRVEDYFREINLSLILRQLLGASTPREWRNRGGMLLLLVYFLLRRQEARNWFYRSRISMSRAKSFAGPRSRTRCWPCRKSATYATGCQAGRPTG